MSNEKRDPDPVNRFAQRLVKDSRKPGSTPISHEQAREKAAEVAKRHDRRNT